MTEALTHDELAALLHWVRKQPWQRLDDVAAAIEQVLKREARLRLRIFQLEHVLDPFAQVLIGEHREDDENVWHSLKAHHFRDARRALRNHGGQKDEHDV